MNAGSESDAGNETTVERQTERELVVTRTFNAPPHVVFEAWTTPELFMQWWAPESFGITVVSSELDIRTGGTYRLVMRATAAAQPMAFFGRYVEVTPPSRLVWTNDEAGDSGAVTTVTFEARGDATLVVVRELYPSKEALDDAIASGSTGAWAEQFAQLEKLLGHGAGGRRP